LWGLSRFESLTSFVWRGRATRGVQAKSARRKIDPEKVGESTIATRGSPRGWMRRVGSEDFGRYVTYSSLSWWCRRCCCGGCFSRLGNRATVSEKSHNTRGGIRGEKKKGRGQVRRRGPRVLSLIRRDSSERVGAVLYAVVLQYGLKGTCGAVRWNEFVDACTHFPWRRSRGRGGAMGGE